MQGIYLGQDDRTCNSGLFLSELARQPQQLVSEAAEKKCSSLTFHSVLSKRCSRSSFHNIASSWTALCIPFQQQIRRSESRGFKKHWSKESGDCGVVVGTLLIYATTFKERLVDFLQLTCLQHLVSCLLFLWFLLVTICVQQSFVFLSVYYVRCKSSVSYIVGTFLYVPLYLHMDLYFHFILVNFVHS